MKNKKNKAAADPVTLREKRRKIGRIRNGILLLLVLIGAVTLRMRSRQAELMKEIAAGDVQQKVTETKLTEEKLAKTMQSYGSLALAEELTMELPGEIKVEQYYVKAGDAVTAGSPIAELNHDTVMAAIFRVENLITSLDQELAEVMNDTVATHLKASLDGTVVQIYGQAGDKVLDTMYEYGALMLLSLDDLLAADLTNTGAFSVGDALTLTGTDGHEAEGRVVGVTRDTITVTVALAEFDYQEQVSITGTVNGKSLSLGSSRLYVYSPQKITGYSGTISSVSVKEGASVNAGKTLLKLTDTDYTADAVVLLGQRDTLVNQYNALIAVSRSGILCAEADGVITSIDETLLVAGEEQESEEKTEDTIAAANEAADNAAMDNAAMAKIPAAYAAEMKCDATGEMGVVATIRTNATPVVSPGRTAGAPAAATAGDASTDPAHTAGESEGHKSGNDAVDDATDDGTEDDITDDSQAGTANEGSDSGSSGNSGASDSSAISKAVEIQWLDALQNPLAAGMPETFNLTLLADGRELQQQEITAEDRWTYVWENLPAYNGSIAISYTISCDIPAGFNGSYKLQGDTMILTFTQISQNQPGNGQGDGSEQGDGNISGDGTVTGEGNGDGGNAPGQNGSSHGNGESGSSANGSRPSFGSLSAAFGTGSRGGSSSSASFSATMGTGSSTGSASADTSAQSSAASYVMDTTSLASYMPNNQVSITITVDELDIAKIRTGMTAEVTLDAIPGQLFRGQITEIGEDGSNSGGNTKYTAMVTMDKTEKMLLGMSASITIPLSEAKAVSTLPMEALIENKGKTYVYTQYDPKTQTLSGLQEVTTGLSDGSKVEITGGLAADTTCYYTENIYQL